MIACYTKRKVTQGCLLLTVKPANIKMTQTVQRLKQKKVLELTDLRNTSKGENLQKLFYFSLHVGSLQSDAIGLKFGKNTDVQREKTPLPLLKYHEVGKIQTFF